MIPEHFKQNTSLDIEVFGFPVQVSYNFYWLGKKGHDQADPLVGHIEYRSDSGIISETGYRSHFFYTRLLENTTHPSIEALVKDIGENLAIGNGYEPPAPARQLRLF